MTSLDTSIGADVPGVWVTIAELAKRKGLSRQSVHERVARLEREGLVQTRQEGRSRLVELATYDRAVGQVGNAAREIGAETKRETSAAATPPAPQTAALRDAQTDKATYDAKLKALEYAERTGQVVAIKGPHGIETALIKVTEELIRDLNQPLNWVADILEKAREGEPALRRLLRAKIAEQRQRIAARMASIAGEAKEQEQSGITVDLTDGDDA